jgi:hypothetical protein
MRRVAAVVLASTLPLAMGCLHPGALSKDSSRARYATAQTRLEAIRRARVWTPTNVSSLNIRIGPTGPGAFAPNAAVTCDYVDKKPGGNSPKFVCVIPPHDEVHVKFGPRNGEVFAEVAASRLFWALGFGVERVYPVRVQCRGCPPAIQGTEMAAIKRNNPGREIETSTVTGWTWPELDEVDPALGAAARAQRGALTLLAVLVQHTDSKPEQQRLICVGHGKKQPGGEPCAEPFMIVHDLGQTFGHANMFNRDSVGSVNLKNWSKMKIWKDPEHCVASLPQSQTGTLADPIITEAGRRFLADLLVQLTDQQLHDLFDVARFTERSEKDKDEELTTVHQWVDAFKAKRDEIVNHTCPGT